MEVKARVILRSAFYSTSRCSPAFFLFSMTLIPTLERLFFRDIIRRAEREGRKVEAVREKVQFKEGKKNHAR
jgi:hypothetical protein